MSIKAYCQQPGGLFIGYAVDMIAPTLIYFTLHALGLSPLWGMAFGCSAAALTTAVNTVKQGRLDRVGLLVLLEIAGSIAFVLLVRDPRLLTLRAALYMEIGGIYVCATSSRGKPVTYSGARAMAARKDPERGAVFDKVWEESSAFRLVLRRSAIACGVAFAAIGILRVVSVYSVPGDRVSLLSNGAQVAIIGSLIAFSALAGRQLGEIADAQISAKT
jgi:hypothetical protein